MLNATAEIYALGVTAHPQSEITSDHRILDVTALRRACQGSMADVLRGDLQSQSLQAILTAMRSVQEADNALDTLIAEYIKSQGTNQAQKPTLKVGRLVRCAANFLLEEFEIPGSRHGKSSWDHTCLSELLRLCARIEPCSLAQSLLALQAAVIHHTKPTIVCND